MSVRHHALLVLLLVALAVACTTQSATSSPTTAVSSVLPQPLRVEEVGFSSYVPIDVKHSSWAIVLENPNPGLAAVGVQLDLESTNESGGRRTQTEQIPVLPPGRHAWAREQPTTTMKPGYWDGRLTDLKVTVKNATWTRDISPLVASFESTEKGKMPQNGPPVTFVHGRVGNGSSPAQVIAVATWRNSEGRLIGGARQVVPVSDSKFTVMQAEPLESVRGDPELSLLPVAALENEAAP